MVGGEEARMVSIATGEQNYDDSVKEREAGL
jgi:hypothetical protein